MDLAKIRHSLAFKYFIFLFCATLVTFLLTLEVAKPSLREFRADYSKWLIQLMTMQGAGGVSAQGLRHEAVASVLKRGAIEAWLIDDQQEVIGSSLGLPPPTDLKKLDLPEFEMEPRCYGSVRALADEICAIKLSVPPARAIVFYFSFQGELSRLRRFIGILVLWGFLIGCLGYFYLERNMRLRYLSASRDESKRGFSLIGALVALLIMGLTLYALQSILTLSFRGSKHADLKLAIRDLSESVRARVSCDKTLEGVNQARDCSDSNPAPLLLKDKNGNPITGPLLSQPRTIDPLSPTLAGSAKLGSWNLRAYCAPGGNLFVRYARALRGDANRASFEEDPLSKRLLNWENSTTNPLFGGAERVLCDGGGASGNSGTWVSFNCAGLPEGGNAGLGCDSYQCPIPGNVSPDQFCVAKGYSRAGHGCRGRPATNPGRQFEGVLVSNNTQINSFNPTQRWVASCWYGNPCMGVPAEIECD